MISSIYKPSIALKYYMYTYFPGLESVIQSTKNSQVQSHQTHPYPSHAWRYNMHHWSCGVLSHRGNW